jgi:hypothetical protein
MAQTTLTWLGTAYAPPTNSLFGGNLLGLTPHGLVEILKATEKEKHVLSVSRLYLCSPCFLYISFPNFNKAHLHLYVLLVFFHTEMQESRSSEASRHHQ